jgi:hypothetical protein
MSILGKVLIIFCLLAATVFIYVGIEDWSARYKWAYAVYRQDLTLKGLPVDARVEDPLQNIPLVENLSDNTIADMFKGLGQPVRTQVEEAERVQKQVAEALNRITDEKARREKWIEIFSPLANNLAELDTIRRRGRDAKVPWSDLEKDMDDLFTTVESAETNDEGKITVQPRPHRPTLSQTLPRDRKQALAHLLFNVHAKVDEASVQADSARLQVVIGLYTFNERAKHQAEALQAMGEQVALMMIGDRAAFEIDYTTQLGELRDRAEAIVSRSLDVSAQQKLKLEHTKLKEDREQDVARANEALAKARKATLAALQQQVTEEDILFKAQRFLGGAKEDNERLERQIRALERATTPGARPGVKLP